MRPSMSRHLRQILLAAFAVALLLPAQAGAGTVVSLTFDDGFADQSVARPLLTSHGMDATFYINSGRVGTTGYLTWAQLHELYADGNEIAGHTIDHVRLPYISETEARRQVCDDRTALRNQGFSVTSFAYPHSSWNSTIGFGQSIVRDCGYASGRVVGFLRDLCSGCPYAESIPPPDPYAIRTPNSIKYDTSLATMQSYVTEAEAHGGGWIVLVFHHICDNACATHAITEADLTAFLDWLQPRAATGTVVKTMQQVIDTTPPTSSITCNGAACASSSYTQPVSVALSATDDPLGSGVAAIRYTTDGSEPTEASPIYSGAFTVSQTTTVKFRAWDVAGNVETTMSKLIQIDTTAPSVTLTSPSDASTVTGLVHVRATASDAESGVAVVRFYLDGNLLGTATSSPFKVAWNTRKTSKGPHILYAVAINGAGQTQTSSSVQVTVS
jgi:peptidoglycan/xylan/chitin deacetylase (PgdA/CDA1 family)